MARNRAIDATLTLPGIARPVGRPRKPDALTGAQRVKLWRKRRKAAFISVTRNGNSSQEVLDALYGLYVRVRDLHPGKPAPQLQAAYQKAGEVLHARGLLKGQKAPGL